MVVLGNTMRIPESLNLARSESISSVQNPKCSNPSVFSSAGTVASDDPGGWDDMFSRVSPPASIVMVIVPGITSLDDIVLALKYFSYQMADCSGFFDLMCTWLMKLSLIHI